MFRVNARRRSGVAPLSSVSIVNFEHVIAGWRTPKIWHSSFTECIFLREKQNNFLFRKLTTAFNVKKQVLIFSLSWKAAVPAYSVALV